jgi:hypothetical protein
VRIVADIRCTIYLLIALLIILIVFSNDASRIDFLAWVMPQSAIALAPAFARLYRPKGSHHNVVAFGCELGLFKCFKSMHMVRRDHGSICIEEMTSRMV